MPTINSRFYIEEDKSKIIYASIENIKRSLKSIYNNKKVKFFVTGITSDDTNREYGRVTHQVKHNPYFNVKVTSLNDDDTSYNSFALNKYGYYPKKLINGYYYGFHLRPVNLSVEVTFCTNDYAQILDYCQHYMTNKKEATYTLKTNDDSGVEIVIKVLLDKDIAIPDKDLGAGDDYKVSCNLTVKTYTGFLMKTPELEKKETIVEFM